MNEIDTMTFRRLYRAGYRIAEASVWLPARTQWQLYSCCVKWARAYINVKMDEVPGDAFHAA